MSTVAKGDVSPSADDRRVLSLTAWVFVLVGTLVPVAVATELFQGRPGWVMPARVLAVSVLLVLSFHDTFRPLRSLALALLAAIGMFNVRVTWFEAVGVTVPSGIWTTLATAVLQALFAVALLVVLLASGVSRERLYLRVGDPAATVDRTWVPGFRRERPWWQAALVWACVPWALLVGYFLAQGSFPVGGDLRTLLAFLPVVVIAAVVNAFGEEAVFRAAPMADLVEALGKHQALLLLGAFFGLSHYYGTPGGPAGVVATGLYATFLAKCVFETRGLALAVLIHFAADATIYLTYLA